MEENEQLQICLNYLRRLKREGKPAAANFDAIVRVLQNEAAAKGLEDEYIELVIDVIIHNDLGSVKCISLIKCLIPRYIISDQSVKRMLIWCLGSVNELPITISTMTVQWIIGLWDYQLVQQKVINVFYDVLFYVMLKKEKLDRHIARLIYVLTKPDDVTRRNVTRLLTLQNTRLSIQTHIMALLLLFKSYKPELVPEKIKAVNIESVWKPTPESLRLGFQNAKSRLEAREARTESQALFNWARLPPGTGSTRKTKAKPFLIPSIGYFNIGSSIFRENDAKSIFDVGGIDDLGKHQLSIDLPCNATALLSNTAGYHLLTFADFQYQSRFSYNLYNTLQKAFIHGNGMFSTEEMDKLLDMTIEFSRYMQRGILVVNLFVDEYLYLNRAKYRGKMLSLMQWMISISVPELQDKIFGHVKNIYYESDVEMKCEILAMFRKLIMNLFVNQGFDECRQTEPAPFLGQGPPDNLTDILPVLMKTVEHLITSGLNIHSYNLLLLDEALALYEVVAILEVRSNMRTWTLAPRAVIYGGFLTKSCAILSRVCGLLLRYREMKLQLKGTRGRTRFKENIRTLLNYVQDIVSSLWYKEAFKTRNSGNFLKSFPRTVLKDLEAIDMDTLLSVESHCAILPHKFTLSMRGLKIESKEDIVKMSKYYFPNVGNLLTLLAD